MKTLLRTGLAAGLLFTALTTAHAQAVPNGGFETWAPRNGVDSPTDWLTTDEVVEELLGQRLPTGTFTKTTDVHGGTYALRLESKQLFIGPLPLGVAPGAVVLGRKLNTNSELGGGLPFTGRPATLQFYYKLTGNLPPSATEGPFAAIELTRTVNGKTEPIAYAERVFTAVVPTYSLTQMTLIYTSAATPDSVHIVFGTGEIGLKDKGTAGTVLQIDDVAFTGTATATRDAALAAAISVSPNPSLDGRYVFGAAEPALLAAPLTVLDATGRVVHREATPGRSVAAATRNLDLSGLPAGVYTVQLFTPRGLVTRKLVR